MHYMSGDMQDACLQPLYDAPGKLPGPTLHLMSVRMISDTQPHSLVIFML